MVDWRKVKISGLSNGHPQHCLKGVPNSVTLLLNIENANLVPQCIETIEQTYSSRSNLLDEPTGSPEANDLPMGAIL